MRDVCQLCKDAHKFNCEHICIHSKDYHMGKKVTVGKPEEMAKALHYYIDWLEAVEKRPNDHRGVNTLDLLYRIQEGYELTENFPTHYTGE